MRNKPAAADDNSLVNLFRPVLTALASSRPVAFACLATALPLAARAAQDPVMENVLADALPFVAGALAGLLAGVGGRSPAVTLPLAAVGLAAFLAAHGKRRIGGYRLLSPARMYLLDRHGYELRHPESWGAVAIAENGLGDCIGLLLRKSSDHELGATLHEFLHETGQVRRWSQSLSRTS